jgi:hypothetical protein
MDLMHKKRDYQAGGDRDAPDSIGTWLKEHLPAV